MDYCYKYPRPAVTVDAILATTEKVLLIQRKNPPFKAQWALPGGFLDENETLEEALLRELEEETAITGLHFQQFKTFSSLDRDPRHRTISTVFWCRISTFDALKYQARDDAQNIGVFNFDQLPELAFDHESIIREFLENPPDKIYL